MRDGLWLAAAWIGGNPLAHARDGDIVQEVVAFEVNPVLRYLTIAAAHVKPVQVEAAIEKSSMACQKPRDRAAFSRAHGTHDWEESIRPDNIAVFIPALKSHAGLELTRSRHSVTVYGRSRLCRKVSTRPAAEVKSFAIRR